MNTMIERTEHYIQQLQRAADFVGVPVSELTCGAYDRINARQWIPTNEENHQEGRWNSKAERDALVAAGTHIDGLPFSSSVRKHFERRWSYAVQAASAQREARQ